MHEPDERPKKGQELVAKLPRKHDDRCLTCKSKYRDVIDRMAVMGFGATHIARQIQEFAPEISRKSVERHMKNHMNYEQEAMRQLLEERYSEIGNLTEEAKTRMVTKHAVLDRMIEKGWDQLMKEDGWIKYQDVLKAIELKSLIETETGTMLQDQLTRQLTAIIQAVKECVPPEDWPRVSARATELYEAPLLEAHGTFVPPQVVENDDEPPLLELPPPEE